MRNHHAKCRGDRSNPSRDIAIFGFFTMVATAILDFENFKFFTTETMKKVEQHHCAKFRRNRSYRGQDMEILRFFNMAAAAILDF